MARVATVVRVKRRKPRGARKEDSIRIRVTEEQKRALVEAAGREGLDVSYWLHSMGLKATGQMLSPAS